MFQWDQPHAYCYRPRKNKNMPQIDEMAIGIHQRQHHIWLHFMPIQSHLSIFFHQEIRTMDLMAMHKDHAWSHSHNYARPSPFHASPSCRSTNEGEVDPCSQPKSATHPPSARNTWQLNFHEQPQGLKLASFVDATKNPECKKLIN